MLRRRIGHWTLVICWSLGFGHCAYSSNRVLQDAHLCKVLPDLPDRLTIPRDQLGDPPVASCCHNVLFDVVEEEDLCATASCRLFDMLVDLIRRFAKTDRLAAEGK